MPIIDSAGDGGGQPGVYGTLGVAAAGNVPGGRVAQGNWTDSQGRFWIFGGIGYDVAGNRGYLSDRWMFDPSSNEWTWMGGSNTVLCNEPQQVPCGNGVYGTMGVPAAGNYPGLRSAEAVWADHQGNIWLFGGLGYDAQGNFGILQDLWEFFPAANQWGWMGGSDTLPSGGAGASVYGTRGVAAPGNIPGGRQWATTWVDDDGNLWLFGGQGGLALGTGWSPYFGDLWEFSPLTGMWTWMGGSSTVVDQPGVYGTISTPGSGNSPGSRGSGIGWVDGDNNLWLYGGNGYDAWGDLGYLNDFWMYNLGAHEWIWMHGPSTLPLLPPDGMSAYRVACLPPSAIRVGAPYAGTYPGCEPPVASWIDKSRNLWFFGTGGGDALGPPGFLDDFWEFQPSAAEWAWMGGRSTEISFWRGVYGTQGVPAPENIAGYRGGASTWTDTQGNFWLFGGMGIDETGHQGYLNDLWKFTFLPVAATPTMSPNAGLYDNSVTIAIEDATPGATIRYTTDGNWPSADSPVYTGPLTLNDWAVVQAIAWKPGEYAASGLAYGVYDVALPTPAPVFSPLGGTYASAQTVAMGDEIDSTIYYTTDGSEPTISSKLLYSAPVSVIARTTIKAIAVGNGGNGYHISPVASADYAINPVFSLAPASPAGSSATVKAGGTATYNLVFSPPSDMTLPTVVDFSASGLPAGATATFTPTTLPAGSPAANVLLSVQTAGKSAMLGQSESRWVFALAVLILPLAGRRRFGFAGTVRTALAVLMLAGAMATMSACSGSGERSRQYTITATVVSGQVQSSTQLTLTVE